MRLGESTRVVSIFVRVYDELWRVNYEKARVRPTTHDMGINSEDPTFFNQSVVGVEGINITRMACLSATNVKNLELLAQIEERAAEDNLAIIQLAQNRRKRKRKLTGDAGSDPGFRGGRTLATITVSCMSLKPKIGSHSWIFSGFHLRYSETWSRDFVKGWQKKDTWYRCIMMTKIKTHYLPFYMIATTPRNSRQCRGHVE